MWMSDRKFKLTIDQFIVGISSALPDDVLLGLRTTPGPCVPPSTPDFLSPFYPGFFYHDVRAESGVQHDTHTPDYHRLFV